MPVQLAQQSFAAGEVAPELYGRPDLAKYHIGARTMLNWYALNKGGASNRPGTAWVGEIVDSGAKGRLIPFQFSTLQTYVLEFGNLKLRIITNGGYVTEATKSITAATQANPCQLTITGHGYSTGDRFYAASVGGMTQLNNRYFDVTVVDANNITIGVDSTGYTAYTSGGTAARLYTVVTPYNTAKLAGLKYEQSADTMTITHNSFAPRKLTRTGNAAWTLDPITFAPAQPSPTDLASDAVGTAAYYVVTAINDDSGEESLPSEEAGSSTETSTLSWTALSGCSSYNVYKKKNGAYGFIGIAQASGTSVSFDDNTIDPNTSLTPPQQRTPFATSLATGVTVTAGGSGYTTPSGKLYDGSKVVSNVSFTVAAGAITAGSLASPRQKVGPNAYILITDGTGAGAILQPQWTDAGDDYGSYISGVTVVAGGAGYAANAKVHSYYYGIVDYGGYVFTPTVVAGAITAVAVARGSGSWSAAEQTLLTIRAADSGGTGAVVAPTLTTDVTTNPGTTTYHDGRQWFANSQASPQTMWGSVSASFNSMAVSVPTQDSDAITRTLASRQVNDIKHMVSLTQMIVLTGGAEWKVSAGQADVITPAQFVARPQSYNGSSDIRPIVVNDMLLFITANQMKVRGLQYQWAADTWSGPDFTLLASHLTESETIIDWQYARDPDSIIWAVRSDGVLLAFTFNNEQQVYAWSRHTMTNGTVESVAVVQEGSESAVYMIVRRALASGVKRYVERLHTRVYATISDAWFLDCALQYSGSSTSTISGLWHLVGESVYALVNGKVQGPFTVSSLGQITLTTAGTLATVGKIIPDADLETLDPEQPDQAGSLQGRKKKVNKATIRLKNSANQGLKVGPSGGQGSPQLYAFKPKDLVNPLATAPSTDPALVTTLEHAQVAPSWDWSGRLLFRVSASPLPYTVTGVSYDLTTG